MKIPSELYNDSLATLTDLYQLTMAYAYWKNNMHEREACFHLFFRKNPFKGNYAIMAGTEYVSSFLENFRFRPDDCAYLATLTGPNGAPLFERSFLNYLTDLKFSCTVDAVKEGSLVFANEPLIRVRGPILQCQLLETALLNIVNFQTLIATKSSRICSAAEGDKVVEFGLRRAQGIDGGLAASRAAYLGGCSATSNVLAGKLFGIPVVGTHAHSWVMSFPTEAEAFEAYAFAMPQNSVFLVDTYDTVEGIKEAIKQGLDLRGRGFEMTGIRLDSGDLCQLSITARQMLDEAGFPAAQIIASNDLDEYKIIELKKNGARINSWGVGTNLVTAQDQPALGGVYKLGAILGSKGWEDKIKLSNDVEKVSNPGLLNAEVTQCKCGMIVHFIINECPETDSPTNFTSSQLDHGKDCHSNNYSVGHRLLSPLFDKGKFVGKRYEIHQLRERATKSVELFKTWPHKVVLEDSLLNRKMKMIDRGNHE